MEFFRKFFQVFGNFDFDHYMVTIYGPVEMTTAYDRLRNECNYDMTLMGLKARMEHFKFRNMQDCIKQMLIDPKELDKKIKTYSAFRLLTHHQGPEDFKNDNKVFNYKNSDLLYKFKKTIN